MDAPQIASRRRRKHVLRIAEDMQEGRVRFKVAGLYIHGKRARKYFATRAEAETFIEAEEIKRENLGTRATHIDGPLAEDAVRAADLLRPHGMTVFDAARLATESVVKLAPYGVGVGEAVNFYVETMRQRQASVSVERLVAEFLENRRAKGKSEIYLRDLDKRLARFVREIGPGRMMSDLQAVEVENWIHGLGVGAQTMNNFRAVLSAAWGFAAKRGYASENVLGKVDKVKVTRDHVATFTPAEVERLLNAAPFEFVPFLAIGVFAGLRPEEIKRLQWAEVSFGDRLITVNATVSKTAKKRHAEISGNLLKWLRPYAGRTGAVACPNLQKLMRQSRRAAGIETWPADVLRHTFASAHYAHHKNPAHTALLLGHRNQDMLMNHYRNLMKPVEAAKFWKIVPQKSKRERKIVPMPRAACA
jgi:integrase/recombinase XerD